MRLERWDLSEIERQRAERNAGLSGFGFNSGFPELETDAQSVTKARKPANIG